MNITAKKAPACRHDDDAIEPAADGFYCTLCDEGVCPDCRKLWRPTGAIDPETGDPEMGPACACNEPVLLPYSHVREGQ